MQDKGKFFSAERKQQKLGLFHLVMLNLPIKERYELANVHVPFIMDNEPAETLNGYTHHLVEELVHLGTTGILVETRDGYNVHIKLRLLLVTADSPAKRWARLCVFVCVFKCVRVV